MGSQRLKQAKAMWIILLLHKLQDNVQAGGHRQKQHDASNSNSSSNSREVDSNEESVTRTSGRLPVDPLEPIFDGSDEGNVEPDILPLYRENWLHIRSRHREGNPLLDVFNFRITGGFHRNEIARYLQTVHQRQSTQYKVNLALGFIMRHVETGALRYFYPSHNNHLLDAPVLIRNQHDLNDFLTRLQDTDILEHIKQNRPDSKWVIELITNITVYIVKIPKHYIGCNITLPDCLMTSRSVVPLLRCPRTWRPYNDKLCFFRCLALAKGYEESNLVTAAKQYTHQFMLHEGQATDMDFDGVSFEDIPTLEDLFSINIEVCELSEEEQDNTVERIVKHVYRSMRKHKDTMYVNHYEGHFSYIKDFDHYAQSYKCSSCDKLFNHFRNLAKHEKTCSAGTKHNFPGGVFQLNPTVFESLDDVGIMVPEGLRFYPYRATFDFECYLDKDSLPSNDAEKLCFVSKHELLSVSVCSNVPSYEEPRCFITDGNPQHLVSEMLQYLQTISERCYEIMKPRFQEFLEELDKRIQKEGGSKEGDDDHPLCRLKTRFINHLKQLPVLGFNSGRYDLNAAKAYMWPELLRESTVKFVIKRCSDYLTLETDTLRFLDISNYVSHGCSYSQFLKAYNATEEKGFFPYEWMDCLKKLGSPSLPSHEAFYSTLKKRNISEEEYLLCQQVWETNRMTTFRDFLDRDLYDTFKSNIIRGPSLIFHRYHEAGKTVVRNKKPCKRIIGYDANALYLWALMQDMPTGFYFCRKICENFCRTLSEPIASQWLDYLATKDDLHIQHRGNARERRLGGRRLPVDGFCEANNTVYQFHGCYWHGHDCDVNRNREVNEVRRKSVQELREETAKNDSYIRDMGFNLVTMWECHYRTMRGTDPDLRAFIRQRNTRYLDRSYTVTEEDIIEAVKDGELFGMVECDLEVPEHLQDHFSKCVLYSRTFPSPGQATKLVNSPHFRCLVDFADDTYEVSSTKKTITIDKPMQIGLFVYQYAKMRMLQFYYNFMCRFFERSDFQYVEMDTDSAYIAIAANSLEGMVKPEMRELYEAERHHWFPRSDHYQYDKRTPGLFKIEWEGDGIVALNSKCYYCFGGDKGDKFSCKGVNKKTNPITKELYLDVLHSKCDQSVTNRGFRLHGLHMYTYQQLKCGFSYLYIKRKVLADGVSTEPLQL
ncbi:uncharacterized protein [Ptychodera flava]|uniref:uncharacterized protein n=1 Tax=Ptychodera flava TaxID=63121 RepID=UPI00396A6AFC